MAARPIRSSSRPEPERGRAVRCGPPETTEEPRMNHPIPRRAALGLAGAALAVAAARAQGDWPNAPIRIIVPFAAGGSTDAVARLVSPGLTRRLGQPVVV